MYGGCCEDVYCLLLLRVSCVMVGGMLVVGCGWHDVVCGVYVVSCAWRGVCGGLWCGRYGVVCIVFEVCCVYYGVWYVMCVVCREVCIV